MTISVTSNLDNNRNTYINQAINNALLNVNTLVIAKVTKVNNNNTVQVESLLRTIALQQNPINPAVIDNIPIMHIMGGSAGIIIEYAIDDVVMLAISQRDISYIKRTFSSKTSNPASNRKFNLADAVVIGKLSNENPSTYIKVTKDYIEILSEKNDIRIGSGALEKALIASTRFEVRNVAGGSAVLPVSIVMGTESQQVKIGK